MEGLTLGGVDWGWVGGEVRGEQEEGWEGELFLVCKINKKLTKKELSS